MSDFEVRRARDHTSRVARERPRQRDSDINTIPDTAQISISGDIHSLTAPYQWNQKIYDSGFYQYHVSKNDQKQNSDYYPINVMEDSPPSITITGIEEYLKLPYSTDLSFNLDIDVKDDYLIKDVYISATVAKGSGESVKFREKRLEIAGFQPAKQLKTQYNIELDELDMEPGSELYFYIAAHDNCPFRDNKSKSLTHIIVLEDTASYVAFDDGGMQVDLMPDFFRSQRQIIIDSEKLLEERGKISKEAFNQRSNELGFDQKQLRLKYGEFLGAHMIGANVTEMIAEVVAARKLETTGHEIIKTVHPHPTMSEAVMEAAAAAYDEVIHL